MARTRQTARKSTGGGAPRRQLSLLGREGLVTTEKETCQSQPETPTETKPNLADLTKYSIVNLDREKFNDVYPDSTASTRLCINLTDSDDANNGDIPIENMPIVDLEDLGDLLDSPLNNFNVTRTTRVLDGASSVTTHGRQFLEHVLERAASA